MGEVLPNGATVAADNFVVWTDGSTWEEVTDSNGCYYILQTEPLALNLANLATLQKKAQGAIDNNITYLGITSPTAAQVTAQVSALTRQMNAVIRVLINAIDTVSGT